MFTTTAVPHLGKRRAMLLGRLLLRHRPEVARELMPHLDTPEADPARIPDYFEAFCALHSLDPDDYRGALYKSFKVERRKLFIACMLRLYNPACFAQPSDAIMVSRSFVARLSATLSQDKGNISRLIRQVIVMERAYEDFRGQVNDTLSKLNPLSHGPEA